MAKNKKTPDTTASAPETITKSEAIRQAIGAGADKPKTGVEWVKTHLGIDVTPQAFSTVKNQMKSGKVKATTATKAAPKPSSNGSGVELAEQVKVLVKLYGADDVVKMVALFAD